MAAGYDNPSYFIIGQWPSYLDAAPTYQMFADLNMNLAEFLTSNSTLTLAGASPYGVYHAQLLENAGGSNVPTLIAAAGAETTMWKVWDEPYDWPTQIVDIVSGAAGSLAGSLAVGRPLWVNFDCNRMHDFNMNSAPTPISSAFSSTTLLDPIGNSRHINNVGYDYYWSSLRTDYPATGTVSSHSPQSYMVGGQHAGASWNTSSNTITIPSSFPTLAISFTTSANRGFQIGATIMLVHGGTDSFVGTVASYVSSTGAMTVNVAVGSHTYTALGNNGTAGIFFNVPLDAFVWNFTFPIVTNLTNPGSIPSNTTLSSFGAGLVGGTTPAWLGQCSNTVNTVANGDVLSVSAIRTPSGAGASYTGGWQVHCAMGSDQCARVTHYGDMIDMMRSTQATHFPAPIINYIENGGPGGNALTLADYITPSQMYGGVWSMVMHGARGYVWFNQSTVGPGQSFRNFEDAYYQSPRGTNTISIFDAAKAINGMVKQFAPVINSPYTDSLSATSNSYVNVSPNGFSLPWLGSYAAMNGFPIDPDPITAYNPDLACVNGVNTQSFEVCGKYYTGATTNRILTPNKFYIMCAYRGAPQDTPTATFTIGNTGSASVTRFYGDGVIGAASNGAGGTRIQTSTTALMATGDTVTISQTTGVTGLNATFSNITVIDATHFDIALAFTGSLTKTGVVISEHTIAVSGGTTFSDTWINGNYIHIYRVN